MDSGGNFHHWPSWLSGIQAQRRITPTALLGLQKDPQSGRHCWLPVSAAVRPLCAQLNSDLEPPFWTSTDKWSLRADSASVPGPRDPGLMVHAAGVHSEQTHTPLCPSTPRVTGQPLAFVRQPVCRFPPPLRLCSTAGAEVGTAKPPWCGRSLLSLCAASSPPVQRRSRSSARSCCAQD